MYRNMIKELDAVCSEQHESILRKYNKEDFVDFTFEKMDNELKQMCPLFRDILHRAAVRLKSHQEEVPILPAVCIAASTILRNRQPRMWALQKMLDLLEDGEKIMLPRCLLEMRYIYLPPVIDRSQNVELNSSNIELEQSTIELEISNIENSILSLEEQDERNIDETSN